MKRTLVILCAAAFLAARAVAADAPAPHPVPSIQDTETKDQRDARMAWWREAKFGMFIHWGVYSIPAGVWKGQPEDGAGEWILNKDKIPVAEYKALAPQFNPTKFNADAWVALAKQAGMKYMVITAKHHDGFAMYASKASSFNIYDATPFKRDPLAELNTAAQKQGLKLGFYYSQYQDWTAPGGGCVNKHWDPAQDGDMGHYFDTKAIPQIAELLADYSPAPAVLWFDTPTKYMPPASAAKIVALLDKYPNLIWNNRLGGNYRGDYETPEQHIPPDGYPGKDWETCMTINDTWGYKSNDTNFKSVDTLLHNLIDVVSKGGNYLLNVGPDSTGTIPQPEQDRLLAIGRWLAANGEAIYGTQGSTLGDTHGTYSPTEKDKKGNPVFNPVWDWRCTTKPGKIYIHLMQWPSGPFVLNHVPSTITNTTLLADPQHQPLKFTQTGSAVTVNLPAQALDPVATVLVLDTK
jgi:alpha-L-fucosidase